MNWSSSWQPVFAQEISLLLSIQQDCRSVSMNWSSSWLPVFAQEISLLLWNSEVHYHHHKSPPLESILSELNPAYILKPLCNRNNEKGLPFILSK
jgi:hypothetical protein